MSTRLSPTVQILRHAAPFVKFQISNLHTAGTHAPRNNRKKTITYSVGPVISLSYDALTRLPSAKITWIREFTPAAWAKPKAREKLVAQAVCGNQPLVGCATSFNLSATVDFSRRQVDLVRLNPACLHSG